MIRGITGHLASWIFAGMLTLPSTARAQIQVTSSKPDNLAAAGESVTFTIRSAVPDRKPRRFVLLRNFWMEIQEGLVNYDSPTSVTASLPEPGALFLAVDNDGDGMNPWYGDATRSTVLVEPEKLLPGSPSPNDFAAFWDRVKKQMDARPVAAQLDRITSVTEVEAFAFNLDAGGGRLGSADGMSAMGYLAKPEGKGPFPAIMIVHGAGSFRADLTEAIRWARKGALAVSLNPHPIRSDLPEEEYDRLRASDLKDYPYIGSTGRETAYFLGMYKRCYRTAQYIVSRRDWDQKHFAVQGFSQGGAQAIVTGALCPHVTTVSALCPALCDHGGVAAGRRPGWPGWVGGAPGELRAKAEAASYYDCANFAPLLNKQTLIGIGLLDLTCNPCSVYAACNRVPGAKRIILMPQTAHGADNLFTQENDRFLAENLGLGSPKKEGTEKP